MHFGFQKSFRDTLPLLLVLHSLAVVGLELLVAKGHSNSYSTAGTFMLDHCHYTTVTVHVSLEHN